jgi:hypothetical protein
MPAHYVWTPRGHIFVGGYWDYPIQRRGIVFAPVYFESSYYARRGYVYSPRIVISLGVFSDHLFLRPSYSHYYFGDYYAPSYYQGGFYASFSFQSSRHGYDPFYSRQRWTHRRDRDWERRTEIVLSASARSRSRASAAHLGGAEKHQCFRLGGRAEVRCWWPRRLIRSPNEMMVACAFSRWRRRSVKKFPDAGGKCNNPVSNGARWRQGRSSDGTQIWRVIPAS